MSENKNEASLKRALGPTSAVLLVVGLLIGSGVFKKIVPMAQTGLNEDAIVWAWIAAGIVSLFGALTISGMSSLTEESGGMYEYFRLSYGNFLAFLSGWADFIIVAPAGVAALGFLFAQTVNTVVPLGNPLESLAHLSIANFIFPFADFGIKLVGIAPIVLLTGVNLLGIREGSMVNNIITIAKMAGILILIYAGVTYSGLASTDVIAGEMSSPLAGVDFFSAFLTAMLGAFWAYHGWDMVSNISGEIINPRRNLPLAMVFGVLIVMTLYTLSNFSYLQVLPVASFRSLGGDEIGALVVADKLFGELGRALFIALMLLSVFGAINSNIVTIPRKCFRMAQEGYFFEHVKRVHSRFRTPYVALTYTMIVSSVLLLSGSFDMLTDMLVFTIFLFYGMLSFAVIRLKLNGTIKVRVIGFPVIPAIFLIFSVAFTVNTILVQPQQSIMAILLTLSGVPFYFYFRRIKK